MSTIGTNELHTRETNLFSAMSSPERKKHKNQQLHSVSLTTFKVTTMTHRPFYKPCLVWVTTVFDCRALRIRGVQLGRTDYDDLSLLAMSVQNNKLVTAVRLVSFLVTVVF